MRLLLWTLSAVVVAVSLSPVDAGTYYNGYVTPAGYTYKDGYWYYGSQPYLRSKVYYPQTYSYYNGYLRADPLTYYWEYNPYYAPTPPPTYTPPATPAYSAGKDWRSQVLDLVKQRDTVESDMRKRMQDHQAYMETVKSLGLEGNFRWPNYGAGPVMPSPAVLPSGHSYYSAQTNYGYPYGTFGAQGNTVYGYSLNTLKEMYGETNMNTLYQQANRLAQNSQSLAGQATGDFSALVDKAGGNAGRVAEIQAKAVMARAILDALNAAPSSRTVTSSAGYSTARSSRTEVAPPTMPPAEAPSGAMTARAQEFLKRTGIPRCGSCHGDKDPKKGWKIANYPLLPPEQKRLVWRRLVSDNKNEVMPPPPAEPLTSQEFLDFINN